jgi:hypothetical protein
MAGGRSPKRKGVRVERALVLLHELGLICSRVPLSGAAGGAWSGDIHLELLGRIHRVEVKARRNFSTLHGWLVGKDLLLLKSDRQPPLTVLPLALLAELVAGTRHREPAPTELATLISFDPVPGRMFCACGAKVNGFSLQRRPDGSGLVSCRSCHNELGHINADLELRS